MGDRANCLVIDGNNAPVHLYTHWGGYELLKDVQTAIQRKARWDDPAYLTRMIFDSMSAGAQGSETGHGISTGVWDNEHDLVYVDTDKQEVRVGENKWGFADFCEADISEVEY